MTTVRYDPEQPFSLTLTLPTATVAALGGAHVATQALAARLASGLAGELGALRTLADDDAALLTAMDVLGARMGVALARMEGAAAPARETWRLHVITAPVYSHLSPAAQARLADIHERVRALLGASADLDGVELVENDR